MDAIKSDVCEYLKLNHNRLHEIELEDIKLEPHIQQNIYRTIAGMFTPDKDFDPASGQQPLDLSELTCKGYWVENTKELILYVWFADQSKAIIIPKNGWNVRHGTAVH